jgi:hypothetical protein
MKRAIFDTNGLPTAFYDDDIHGDTLPSGAVAISDEQWREFLEHQGRRRWQDGHVVAYEPPPPPPPPRVFSKRRMFLALTDAEYAIFEAIEAQQPARDRRAFAEAADINEADPDFPQFLGLMHAAYGEARTGEILAASAF